MPYWSYKPGDPQTLPWLQDQKAKAELGDLVAGQELADYYCFQDRCYSQSFKYGKVLVLKGVKTNYFRMMPRDGDLSLDQGLVFLGEVLTWCQEVETKLMDDIIPRFREVDVDQCCHTVEETQEFTDHLQYVTELIEYYIRWWGLDPILRGLELLYKDERIAWRDYLLSQHHPVDQGWSYLQNSCRLGLEYAIREVSKPKWRTYILSMFQALS